MREVAMTASVVDMPSRYAPIAPRPSTRTIYEIREIAELFGRNALSPADLPRLDQHYAAVSYGPVAVSYAHPDVYGEQLYTSESDAHRARRGFIARGASVSLVAFDPSRDRYTFDVIGW